MFPISVDSDLTQTDIGYEKFKRLRKTYLFGLWDRGALWLFVWIAPLEIFLLTIYLLDLAAITLIHFPCAHRGW